MLLEPGRVGALPAWRAGAAVARRVGCEAGLSLDVLDRLALGAGDVVLGVDLAKWCGVGGCGVGGGGGRVVSKRDPVRRDLVPPPPATRLMPGKQSATNLTESVTMMAPRCPASGTQHRYPGWARSPLVSRFSKEPPSSP